MTATAVETFEASLADLGVGWTVADPADATAAIAEAIEEPAVGVPLGYDAVALPEAVEDEPTMGDLEAATTGVTPAPLGVADYGSVVVEGAPIGDEPVSLFAERHVAVLDEHDLVADMPAAFDRIGELIREGRDDLILTTGPSATADMGALVKGAHGPREVHVVLIERPDDEDGSAAGEGGQR